MGDTFERPSVEKELRDLRRRMEVLERVVRGGLKPPWTQDDSGHVFGTTPFDEPTIGARPLELQAQGTAASVALSIDAVSGDGTPDSGGTAIGVDMGGDFSSDEDARVHSDGGRAVGVQLDVTSQGADAYAMRGSVEGTDGGQAKGVDLNVTADEFSNATGAELDATVEEGIATGLKVTAVETGAGGRARGIDVTGPVVLRIHAAASEPPFDPAGPILYAFDNAGTTEIRVNVGGVVHVLAP